MFNLEVRTEDYKKLKAEMQQRGLTVCVEQSYQDSGKRYVDVRIGNVSDKYISRLADYCYSRYSY